MIYKCENCKNRGNCPEKQEGYIKLCKDIENIDKNSYHNCYYSLSLKCDYWVKDEATLTGSEETCLCKGGAE